jgi:hemoglobin-like flavoprotein
MKSRQLALVRESFEQLRPIPRAFGIRFYERLFQLDSSLRPLFKGDLENQAAMFSTALAMSVAGLGDDEYAPASIRELAARHNEYGIPESAYVTFGDALMSTLEESLGGRFTPGVKEAWEAAYETLASVMRQAAEDARLAKAAEERSRKNDPGAA